MVEGFPHLLAADGCAEAGEEIWYRYDDVLVSSGIDVDGDPIGPGYVAVRLHRMLVRKRTPKGVWIGLRFVLNSATKRYACPTIDEAKASFIARKTRQARIHHARARHAEEAIKIIESGKVRDPFQ